MSRARTAAEAKKFLQESLDAGERSPQRKKKPSSPRARQRHEREAEARNRHARRANPGSAAARVWEGYDPEWPASPIAEHPTTSLERGTRAMSPSRAHALSPQRDDGSPGDQWVSSLRDSTPRAALERTLDYDEDDGDIERTQDIGNTTGYRRQKEAAQRLSRTPTHASAGTGVFGSPNTPGAHERLNVDVGSRDGTFAPTSFRALAVATAAHPTRSPTRSAGTRGFFAAVSQPDEPAGFAADDAQMMSAIDPHGEDITGMREESSILAIPPGTATGLSPREQELRAQVTKWANVDPLLHAVSVTNHGSLSTCIHEEVERKPRRLEAEEWKVELKEELMTGQRSTTHPFSPQAGGGGGVTLSDPEHLSRYEDDPSAHDVTGSRVENHQTRHRGGEDRRAAQRKHVDGIELHTSYVHPTSDTGTGSTVPLVEMRTRMGSGVTGKKREQSLPSTDFDGRVARGQVAESEQERYRPEGVEVESIMALKAELAARQEEQDKHPLPNSTGGVRLLRVGEQPVGGRHAPATAADEPPTRPHLDPHRDLQPRGTSRAELQR